MQGFLITLLICSVTMSALALFYMALTPLLSKRYSAVSRYYSWIVIVTGLVIPFRPQFCNAIVRLDMPVNTAGPFIWTGNRTPVNIPAPIDHALPFALPAVSWWNITATVWLAGMILFLAYHIIRHYRFLKLAARWSETVTDEQAQALIKSLKAQMGLSKNIGLQFCDSIGSPMMIGFVNPRILLPNAEFTEDELRFILKHELVHYKRRDLWYKGLMLAATAIHWFNPVVYLMAKAIDRQCELSCDAEVVRSTDADTRQYYSETILSVVRYQSKLKTALSTNFYGGKKGMKHRIFSIMDMGEKKSGAAVLCGALILTLGTGLVTASAETQKQEIHKDNPVVVTPQIAIDGFVPSPDTYAPYAPFGIMISDDGGELLYKGQPVRQFVDEKADSWAFYLDETGSRNLSVIRNSAGEIRGIESITAQKAQEYYEDFFAEELALDIAANVQKQDQVIVNEEIQEGGNKYDKYRSFGITYSTKEEVLYYHGQRVKFLVDHTAGEEPGTLWTDDTGTVNLMVLRGMSGQITGIDSISDKKAQEYQAAADESNQNSLKGLEKRAEERINALYPEN